MDEIVVTGTITREMIRKGVRKSPKLCPVGLWLATLYPWHSVGLTHAQIETPDGVAYEAKLMPHLTNWISTYDSQLGGRVMLETSVELHFVRLPDERQEIGHKLRALELLGAPVSGGEHE